MQDVETSSASGATAPLSVTALQGELRQLFRTQPAHRALRGSLERISMHLGARYAVVHARLGVQLLSEEWTRNGEDVDDALREAVNTTMWETMATGNARCSRLGADADRAATAAAVAILDEDIEQAGAAAIVVEDCDRARSLEILSLFEGLVGFLSVLVTGEGGAATDADGAQQDDRFCVRPDEAAEHPIRLAFTMAAELKNRHGLDMSAIGFVRGSRVKVAAICGLEEVRGANPGVKLIRAAMEECLDRRASVVCTGHLFQEESTPNEDCRMHSQWSKAVGGDAVASFPLFLYGETIAVVSLRHSTPRQLTNETVAELAAGMANYGALIWLSRAASRGLLAHSADAVRGSFQKLLDNGRRWTLAAAVLLIALAAWLGFGQLPYSFTVPCVIRAADHRVVASPRAGILSKLLVKPGDQVRKGQLLATLDAREDELRRAELIAERAALEAYSDQALAENDAGRARIYEAQRKSIAAQLAVVEQSIGQARIRAPQPGVVLDGDLREKLGGRISIGEPLFELARHDRMSVRMQIPERLLLQARDSFDCVFAPSARPSDEYRLSRMAIAPASKIVDGRNVFIGESQVAATVQSLSPGMEGVAHLSVGFRPVWWVLSHRVVDWLKLRFWL